MAMSPGFRITSNKGFHITFSNGMTVSVQFGRANYCQNYDSGFSESAMVSCPDAEVAIWNSDSLWMTDTVLGNGDDVVGYVTPDRLLEILDKAAAWRGTAPGAKQGGEDDKGRV